MSPHGMTATVVSVAAQTDLYSGQHHIEGEETA